MSLFIIFLITIHYAKPFKLRILGTNKYLGMAQNKPVMVSKVHALFYDIRTTPDHASSVCTVEHCLFHSQTLEYSSKHSTDFFVILNEDETITFRAKNNCLSEEDGKVFIGNCGDFNDKFEKIKEENALDIEDTGDSVEKGEDNVIFNYGKENTSHVVDNIVNMKKDDVNYSLIPVERNHNSHVHKVGGFADRAFYTYYSYHPSSRHSTYNFHNRHHGVPKTWAKNPLMGLKNKFTKKLSKTFGLK